MASDRTSARQPVRHPGLAAHSLSLAVLRNQRRELRMGTGRQVPGFRSRFPIDAPVELLQVEQAGRRLDRS